MVLRIPVPLVLAAVAAVSYLLGHRREAARDEPMARSRGELRRVRAVADELERTTAAVRKSLARHGT